MMKNSGLRIRIERELRDKFLTLCRRQDRPAAQVIREFMRDYIDKHESEFANDMSRYSSNDQPKKLGGKGH